MQLFENIGMALTSVRSNKMRSLLTMLGIIIVIAMVFSVITVFVGWFLLRQKQQQEIGRAHV